MQKTALVDVAPTHVFIAAWMRQATEAENIRVNGAMVRHVSLVTGLKHYLGPFEAYASAGTLPETPLRVTASAGKSTDRTLSSARPLAMALGHRLGFGSAD